MELSSESSENENDNEIIKKQLKNNLNKKKRKDKKSIDENIIKKLKQKEDIDSDIKKEQEVDESIAKNKNKNKMNHLYTVSIAVPGSIIENAQTKELKTYLAGQIARAAVIYKIDEIIVYDDKLSKTYNSGDTQNKKNSNCNEFLARILRYLETPQYLRKALFPVHNDLVFAGLLNPLNCPHHVLSNESSKYREAVVLDRPVKIGTGKTIHGSFVNAGLGIDVQIDKVLKPGVRVTVILDDPTKRKNKIYGKAVSPREPVESEGIYWGYTTRLVSSLGELLRTCPYNKEGRYDVTIGTSERGKTMSDSENILLPKNKNILIVFGGVYGIEECANADESLKISGEDASSLFDFWINTCPNQGSKTIRTEEAILITLCGMQKYIQK